MKEASSKHASVDTFAKKLYIKGNIQDLDKLKIALSVFLIFEQARNPIDSRYDTFFASILNDIHKLPENIRILSWNYDYQFELAFSEFSDDKDISRNHSNLNINSKNNLGIFQNNNYNRFNIYKINGTTGIYHESRRSNYYFSTDLHNGLTKNFIERVVLSYVIVHNDRNQYCSLSFAWEDEWVNNKSLDSAIESINDSTILVVVGYSFPFFNREIDRKILSGMKNLKKVYIQAPNADSIIERFESIKNDLSSVKIIPRYEVEQFFIPNEL